MVERFSATVIFTEQQAGYINQDVKATASPTFAALATNGAGPSTFAPTAGAGGAGAVGHAFTAGAGAGSAAGGGTPGAIGGVPSLAGGVGGASDGTDAAGLGAATVVAGGIGGVAHTAVVGGVGGAINIAGGAGGAGVAAAAGGAGGDSTMNAGAGGATGGAGAGANGSLYIGAANTAAISVGNVTDNPLVSILGTGDVSLLGGGDLRYGRLVQVVITAVGGTGGATAGTFDVQVNDLNGTAITRAVTLFVDSSQTQYAGPHTATGTGFFGAASVGTLVAGTGTLSAIITTDATGHYVSVTANNADETCWFSARTAEGGHVNAAAGCVVVDCVPNDATWAA